MKEAINPLVHLVRIVLVEVVAADLHSELAGGHTVTAVAGCDNLGFGKSFNEEKVQKYHEQTDLVGSDDGASAHEAAAHTAGQHDLGEAVTHVPSFGPSWDRSRPS